jgi:hypothetical protein
MTQRGSADPKEVENLTLLTDTGAKLASYVERISKFSGASLASTISNLEFGFARLEKREIAEKLRSSLIDNDLLDAARAIKRAAAQIDVVLHTLGILLTSSGDFH